MNDDDTTANINPFDALLASKGLDVGDLISAIDPIAKIKERGLRKLDKEEAKEASKQKRLY